MIECPKCHYQRRAIDAQVNADICPACGIVYAKWIARQQTMSSINTETIDTDEEPRQTFHDFIFYVPEKIDPAVFWTRVATLAAFTLWSFYFMRGGVDWQNIGSSFLHGPDLAFHEFGHIFFAPFGHFMMILGGSLFQILLPLFLMVVFMWKQHDNFAASIMLWWSGQNFIDVSPYIDDAQYRLLPLVGGGGEESHDWGNILTMTHALEKTHTIAHISFNTGALMMVIALVWGSHILRLQKKKLLAN